MSTWNTERSSTSGYRSLLDAGSSNTAIDGIWSRLMLLRLSSNPSPPHHNTPATCGSPANSWYAFTPAVSSMPASRWTTSTFRPPTPPLELICWTAASSELRVMLPTNEPTPEYGAMTPNLIVSLAPACFFEPDPLEQAASTGDATAPRPATIPHRNSCRRETSGVTTRG